MLACRLGILRFETFPFYLLSYVLVLFSSARVFEKRTSFFKMMNSGLSYSYHMIPLSLHFPNLAGKLKEEGRDQRHLIYLVGCSTSARSEMKDRCSS